MEKDDPENYKIRKRVSDLVEAKHTIDLGAELKASCELWSWFLMELNYFCCQIYYPLVHNIPEIKIPQIQQNNFCEEVKIDLLIMYTGIYL